MTYAITSVQRAQTEWLALEQSTTFIKDLFEQFDPKGATASTLTPRELVDESLERARMNFRDQPKLLAMVLSESGRTYERLGLYEEAVLLQQEALAVSQRGAGGGDVRGRTELDARIYQNLGIALHSHHFYAEAEHYLNRALEEWTRLAGPDGLETVRTRVALAQLYRNMGRLEEAIALAEQANASVEKGNLEDVRLAVFNTLAMSYRSGGHLDEAERVHRQVVDLRRENAPQTPELAESLANLALVLNEQYQQTADDALLHEADRALTEGLEILRRAYTPDHPDLGRVFDIHGIVLTNMEQLDSAVVRFQEALQIFAVDEEALLPLRARTLNNLSNAYEKADRLKEARAALEEAIQIRDLLGLGTDPETGVALYNLGYIIASEDPEEALNAFTRALGAFRQAYSAEHHFTLATKAAMGRLHLEQGRPETAEPLLRTVLRDRQRTLEPDNWRIASAQHLLGSCLLQLGHLDEAGPLLEESYDRLHHLFGPDHERTQRALATLNEWRTAKA